MKSIGMKNGIVLSCWRREVRTRLRQAMNQATDHGATRNRNETLLVIMKGWTAFFGSNATGLILTAAFAAGLLGCENRQAQTRSNLAQQREVAGGSGECDADLVPSGVGVYNVTNREIWVRATWFHKHGGGPGRWCSGTGPWQKLEPKPGAVGTWVPVMAPNGAQNGLQAVFPHNGSWISVASHSGTYGGRRNTFHILPKRRNPFPNPLIPGLGHYTEEPPKDCAPAEPWLGVSIEDVTEPFDGARITYVTPGSPAAIAGLQVGDIVTRANFHRSESIDSANDLVNFVQKGEPGIYMGLSFRRPPFATGANSGSSVITSWGASPVLGIKPGTGNCIGGPPPDDWKPQ